MSYSVETWYVGSGTPDITHVVCRQQMCIYLICKSVLIG